MLTVEQIIKKPLLTEKSSVVTEKTNRYTFEVALSANKHQVKAAIEKLFDVKVIKVNTLINSGKLRRTKKSTVKLPKTKKAYVQVKEGQKIELFRGI